MFERSRVVMWEQGRRMMAGLKIRIAATFALAVGGVVWILLYAAFWAGHFAWFQNLAVILSTLLVVPTVMIVMWILWGVGMRRRLRLDDPFGPW